MSSKSLFHLLAAAGLALVSTAALSESLAGGASSASSAASSASHSLKASSASSAPTKTAQAGTWRVLAMADVQPGAEVRVVTLTLAQDAGQTLEVNMPLAVIAEAALQPGQMLELSHQPYGLAFAHAAKGDPFFLVLNDEVFDGMAARPVTL